MENQTEQSALQAGEKATVSISSSTRGTGLPHSEGTLREGIVINIPPVKEEQGWSATTTPPQEARLPYLAPTIEVIEVKTEVGYAGSNTGNNFGNGGRW